ncbi:DNA mismatch repair protein Mlh3 isoform X2 [Melanotaenia boesemani]|uniref:DNA mismatch repair protein Mlh3 isoform X2 n=1 Tax=Melanotaenia boesemani TaxID=1250792 RepID=UPI001C056A32|nr:DNA mismatch repair protein Mlh3 isoform X2 [Melanotaenia boesemani]
MIKCLPEEVRGKLRTGVAIPSLQQCVEELILNSIDAGATCVGVRMDMEAFKVQVIDNGVGMSIDDMECVGNRYHTSKCSCFEDLDNLRWYGFRGEALASIISLATLVEISSRTRSSVKTHVKLFKDGKGLAVFEAETARPSAGTTVIICNFFHNMPVRRKRLDVVLEGERIRHRLEAISLMHPSVSFTLKNDCTGTMMVQLPKARNTYHRFIQIHGLARAEKLGEISYTHQQFEINGYLGKEGHYNNSLQFLYVNERLLLKTRIHKLLNVLLRRLSSSNQKNDSPDVQSIIKSPKHKRNHELYGVYTINIKCSYSEYDICLEPAKTLIEFKDWDGIVLCVEEAVNTFLKRENLVSVFSQDDLDCVSPKVLDTDKTDREEGIDKATSMLDCSFGTKLASEFVHRKSTDEGVYQESGLIVCKSDQPEQLAQKKPASFNISDEDESTSGETGEGSEVLHMPNGQQLIQIKEQETQPSSDTAICDADPRHSLIQPVQPDLDSTEQIMPCTGRHEQTLVGNRKISLSDPYIHECLQIQEPFQSSRSVFQECNLTAKCEEKSVAPKHKISLEACRDRSSWKLCRGFDPVIPSKIPRVSSCQGLSTVMDLGSLDKFRSAYVKSNEVKLPPVHLQNATLPQTNSFTLNPKSISISQDDRQMSGVQEMPVEEEKQSSFQIPPDLSADKAENRSKISLAAKLCHLKQNKTENAMSRNTSVDKISLSSGKKGSKDGNDRENSHDSAVDNESVLACSTNPELAGNEEGSTSGDWLHHYDTSVGKIVYVNRMTGLSRYEDLGKEETQVQCTSDVTNMAVNVISKLDYGGESSNSLSSLYSEWNNPVFVRPPMVGVDISSGQADGLAVKIHNILFPYRFSKAMIHSMKVIDQVDKKFLACLIDTRDEEPTVHSETEGNLLVLVDQHAAHERVRLENLVADSYEDDPDAPGERRLCSSTILPPLEISLTEEELRLLRSCQTHLRSLGLEVTFSHTAAPQVFVAKVPLCFMEKESNELRRGRPSVIKPIVEEYLQEQIELLRSTGRVRGTLPLTVLKVLASLACHGAIKFNDTLSRDECCSLVASLSSCQLPFQCAHGRPSIVPLVDILHLDDDQKDFQKPNLQKLKRMHKAWELFGNR